MPFFDELRWNSVIAQHTYKSPLEWVLVLLHEVLSGRWHTICHDGASGEHTVRILVYGSLSSSETGEK